MLRPVVGFDDLLALLVLLDRIVEVLHLLIDLTFCQETHSVQVQLAVVLLPVEIFVLRRDSLLFQQVNDVVDDTLSKYDSSLAKLSSLVVLVQKGLSVCNIEVTLH